MVHLSSQSAVPLVSLCCLMVLSWAAAAAAAAAAAGDSKCRTEQQVNATANLPSWSNLSRHFEEKLRMRNTQPFNCTEAAKQMAGDASARALAPWNYSLDEDSSRIPRSIARATCLCEGCIINQKETNDYNSVVVKTKVVVLKKTRCNNDDLYRLKKEVIEVPVGCTCVRPRLH